MTLASRKGQIAVYTAIFGGYDLYAEPQPDGFDVFLITDGRLAGVTPRHATVLTVSKEWEAPGGVNWRALDDTRRARYWKINSHLQVNPVWEYEYSLWVDASFTLDRVNIRELIRKYLASSDIATCRHPSRNCIYEEGAIVVACGKDDPAVVKAHLDRYRARMYPSRGGLAETGILLRRHTPEIAEFNSYWWRELASGSKRDQISFSYCVNTMGVRVSYFDDRRSLGFVNRSRLR